MELNLLIRQLDFGYIKFADDKNKNYSIVEEFNEKPNKEKALNYFKSGKYYWNSGMFIWKIETILEEYRNYLPELYKYKEELEQTRASDNEKLKVERIYNKVESISIDKGILEKSQNVKMLKGHFEWLDIGSINDFFKIKDKDQNQNVKIGNVIVNDTKKTSIYNENANFLIATIGVEDINIINCNNVILIAEKGKMNNLPRIIEEIKNSEKYKKFL